jgi:hypothetical protein
MRIIEKRPRDWFTSPTVKFRGPIMTPSNEIEIRNIAIASLHKSICQRTIRLLNVDSPSVDHFRRVERLMRIAIALSGAGSTRAPHVKIHNLPSEGGSDTLPAILSIDLADLLAARAAESLPGALRGEPEALLALVREGSHLLETEEIQLG